MPDTLFKIAKRVSSPPTTFGANEVYAVRVGVGFDFYITDSTGTNIFKMNTKDYANEVPLFVQDTQPTGVQGKYVWFNTSEGDLQILYEDGT